MGKGGGSSPKPPNPEKTAQAQAYWNTYDTYGPDGSGVRHGTTDASGNFVPTQAGGRPSQAKKYVESPTERAIREMINPASVDFTGQMISDNVDNLPGPGRVGGRGDVAQDIFDRNYSMMQPAIEQGNDRLLSNLQARGLPVGGEAFNEAYGAQQRETQDTISRLAQDANVGAGQEQSRTLAMDQSVRQNAMSELSALMGGAYQAPSKTPSAGGPNIDYAGMANNQFRAQQANAQQEAQQRQSTFSTIGSIGAALLKSAGSSKAMTGEVDPEWAGNVVQAMPIYEWSYLPGEGPEGDTATHIGPLAEDFHGLTGLSGPGAISVIDYLGLLLAALQDTVNRVEVLENALSNQRVH